MTFDHAALAVVAHEERMRRVSAWRGMIAQGKTTRARAQADELLWYEIEILCRRYAGEEEARRHQYPRSFTDLAKTARNTLTAACNAISDDDPAGCANIRGLWELTRWLEICALGARRHEAPALEKAA